MSEPVALTSAQINEASQALARAFFDDPYVEFIQPDPEKRLKPTETFMRTALRYGLRYGHVDVPAEGPQASAVWLPPGDSPAGTFRSLLCGIGLMPFQLGFSGTGKLFATLGYADGLHKKEMTRPHWYLWVLGVEPEKQGQGLGGQVLQPTLRRADEENLPCYLETVKEKNLAFYEKQGFKVEREDRFPRGGPKFWTMLREPVR